MTSKRFRIQSASTLAVVVGALLVGCAPDVGGSVEEMRDRAAGIGYSCTDTVPATGQPVDTYVTCVSGDLELRIVAFKSEEDLKANQSGYSPSEMSWQSSASILVVGSDEQDVAEVMGEEA